MYRYPFKRTRLILSKDDSHDCYSFVMFHPIFPCLLSEKSCFFKLLKVNLLTCWFEKWGSGITLTPLLFNQVHANILFQQFITKRYCFFIDTRFFIIIHVLSQQSLYYQTVNLTDIFCIIKMNISL